MTEVLLYILCGLAAGTLGGYLGLGGGVVMVPFLTILVGIPIKEAVPISITAILATSLASSNEYLKKEMVDLKFTVILCLFMVIGASTGSYISRFVSGEAIQVIFSILVVYTAISFLKNRKETDQTVQQANRQKNTIICIFIALGSGIIAALLGIGGGAILIPLLYLLIGIPLTTARGTSSLLVGFSSGAASLVYLIQGQIDFQITAGVIIGILLGGKIGGYLGTIAKPFAVKIIFFILMMYLAFKLSYGPIAEYFG
ncbi:MAG: sulfite exporter TauE/SafE family protein [Calditrichaeota bacterium]|nr:MAG: sulfite exporter TauE/SafE family protein [Calditrichota bacterium]